MSLPTPLATTTRAGLMSPGDKDRLGRALVPAGDGTVPGLATVATSGSYTDLANKPVIPATFTRGQIVAMAYGDPLNFF